MQKNDLPVFPALTVVLARDERIVAINERNAADWKVRSPALQELMSDRTTVALIEDDLRHLGIGGFRAWSLWDSANHAKRRMQIVLSEVGRRARKARRRDPFEQLCEEIVLANPTIDELTLLSKLTEQRHGRIACSVHDRMIEVDSGQAERPRNFAVSGLKHRISRIRKAHGLTHR